MEVLRDSRVRVDTRVFQERRSAGIQDTAEVLPADIQDTADRVTAGILLVVGIQGSVAAQGTQGFPVIVGVDFQATVGIPVKAGTPDSAGKVVTRVTAVTPVNLVILVTAVNQGTRDSPVQVDIPDLAVTRG